MAESIPNWLLQRAYLTPNRVGLIFNGEKWTFAEMANQIHTVAKRLDIREGERIAVLLKNTPDAVWIIHALQQYGAETVFLNNRLTIPELLFQVEDSESKKLIFDDGFHSLAADIKNSAENIKTICVQKLSEATVRNFQEKAEFELNRVCSIMYTSGTTGNPKGVLQTYGNHWWSATGSALNLGLHADDAWLCAVPLFHISGMSILMRSVIYGIPVYLQEGFSEDEANQLLQSGKITIMSVVSAMLNRMLRNIGNEKYHGNFRCMLLGGGAAQRRQLELCKEKGIPVFQTYGMTETSSQIVTLAPEDSMRKLGSAGKPLFPSQIQVINQNDEKAAPHEAGEIFVKGPNVTKGYLNRKAANEEAFSNGWFRTGDLGFFDEEGFLFILDRRTDLIISGGENVYPAEIEDVLMGMPGVVEAGVTGVEHSIWGKVPYAFIVSEGEISEEDVLGFCRKKLAAYKLPKRVFQIEALPRNGANKILRRELLRYIPKK